MKSIAIGDLFTPAQLKQAATILSKPGSPHAELVALLKPDQARFDSLEVDLNYAAYVMEWQAGAILAVYGNKK